MIQVKIVQNFFVSKTSFNRFIFISNVFKPNCTEFVSIDEDIKDADHNLSWNVFAPKSLLSEKIELHVCHPKCGVIQVV